MTNHKLHNLRTCYSMRVIFCHNLNSPRTPFNNSSFTFASANAFSRNVILKYSPWLRSQKGNLNKRYCRDILGMLVVPAFFYFSSWGDFQLFLSLFLSFFFVSATLLEKRKPKSVKKCFLQNNLKSKIENTFLKEKLRNLSTKIKHNNCWVTYQFS